jgi:uncharacterized integral membrane protein
LAFQVLSAFRFFFLLVSIVLFVAFAVSNRDPVVVGLFPLPYTAQMPKFLFALICFGLGIIVAGISLNLRMAKTRRKFAKEHKRSMALENELKGIKAEKDGLPATLDRDAA